jgi:hypothetical protein
MYYVLMNHSDDKVGVVGKHDTEDDAREHEEMLTKSYLDCHFWTCPDSELIGDRLDAFA